jgi:hypothetical protein
MVDWIDVRVHCDRVRRGLSAQASPFQDQPFWRPDNFRLPVPRKIGAESLSTLIDRHNPFGTHAVLRSYRNSAAYYNRTFRVPWVTIGITTSQCVWYFKQLLH